jgi:hypothetical protein
MKSRGFLKSMVLIWMRNGFGLIVKLLRSYVGKGEILSPELRFACKGLFASYAFGVAGLWVIHIQVL